MSETIDRPETGALVVSGVSLPAPRILGADKDNLLGKLAEDLAQHKPDVTTPRGRKEIASLAYRVSTTKAELIRLGKGLTEEWRKATKAVNEECNVLEANMDELRDKVRAPLTAYEDREKARIKGHEDALDAIRENPAWGPTESSTEIRSRIAALENYPTRNWEEFEQKAADALANELLRAKAFLIDALAREEAEMEAERQRLEAEEAARVAAEKAQREREARIAAEAAEAARVAAEARAAEAAAMERQRVERERLDAEDARREAELAAQAEIEAMEEARRIEADRARQAEERAANAERERLAAEKRAEAARIEAAARAERDRLAAIEAERARVAAEKAAEEAAAAERARNLEIKRRVNFDAAAALIVKAGLTEQQAQRVVIAIAKREIPAVEIRY
ncbi:MAG TPA: hypothetical protein VFG62_25965 [Rhodopila sp.]|nr:hypothetical protein [Rhodopila sp.]